jgi:hypothetical protein
MVVVGLEVSLCERWNKSAYSGKTPSSALPERWNNGTCSGLV